MNARVLISLVIWVFLFFSTNVVSQTFIQGSILDSISNPVSFANVLIQSKTGNDIIAFGYTDTKGRYRIEVDTIGEYTLSISALSFEQAKVPISITKDTKSVEKDIILKNETFALDEVIINTDAPITVKKDTIIFKVRHFTDGNEEVAEDVLKKLPGMAVGDDGEIKVQGKSIEKVMVEGDDLFEKGYSLLTKNLNSGVIDKVEVLEHFSDNPLLKGVEDSDKVALNITLKKDRKTSLFGNASLGYGTDQFYENRLNLISFNKKTKFYFFGNLNNTGVDATGDIYKIINPDIFSGVKYIGDNASIQELIDIEGYKPNLKAERLNFNNSEFASLNGIYNPNDKLKIKGLIFFNTDEHDFFNKNVTRYTLGNDSFINTEDQKVRKRQITGFGKWDAIYSISNNARLEYVGKYNRVSKESIGQSIFNEEPINKALDTDIDFIDQRVTYTNRTKDKNALLITGRYIYDKKPQVFALDKFLFQEIFPEAGAVDIVQQNISQQLNFIGVEGNYITNIKKNNLDIKLGYAHTNNHLNSYLSLIENDTETNTTNTDFSNDLSYVLNDIYNTIKYKWDLGKVAIRASLDAHQIFTTVNQDTQTNSESIFYVVPNIGMNWNINEKNKLSALYKYNTRNYTNADVQKGYLLTDFRHFRRGVGDFGQLGGSFFLANYTLGNWSDEFLMNSSFIYQKDDEYRSTRSEIQPNYNLSETVILKNKESYTWNLSMDKYVSKLSSNLKIKGGISETNLENIVNGSDLRAINTTSFDYGAEFRSVFSGIFNFHLGTRWITSRVKINNEISNTNNDSFLDLNFEVSKKFNFNLKNERYYFGNIDENNTYYFTDVNMQYVIKKNALKLKFTAQNIWNTNTFATSFIGDTSQFTSEYRLLPRYFLLKLDFRF